MRIFYSGIELEVNQLIEFSRTPVYTDDKTDYLYTQFVIRAVGLVSSTQIQGLLSTAGVSTTAGMSYAPTRIFSTPPTVPSEEGILRTGSYGPPAIFDVVSDLSSSIVAGALSARPPSSAKTQGLPSEIVKTTLSNPIITDKTIRHWLSVPRRKLVVCNHNPTKVDVLVESPPNGRICDAKNGPFVDVFGIQAATGDPQMFLVGLQVTTYLNECENNEQNFGAFLSNRYSQIHDINEDGYLVITTTGKAYFRTDLVYGFANPDSVRQFLMLPVPNGFHRSNIKVAGNPDSTGLSYSFIDTQQHSQFVVGDEVGATRLEGTYRCGVSQGAETLNALLGTVERQYDLAVRRKQLQDSASASQAPVVHHHYTMTGPPPVPPSSSPKP